MVTMLQRGLLALACLCLAVLVGLPVPGCKGEPSWKHEVSAPLVGDKPAAPGQLVQTATIVMPKLAPGYTAADVEKAIAEMWAQADMGVAKVKAEAKVKEAAAREGAKDDFRNTVKRWTGWAMGIIVALSVAALIASFVPITKSLVSTGDAAKGFGAVVALGLVRYALLQWGILAANVAMWVCIVLAALALVAFGVPMAISLYRRQLHKVADALEAKGETRPAVAVRAAAIGATGEDEFAKRERKKLLAAVVKTGEGG